jgi:hypothetical protein
MKKPAPRILSAGGPDMDETVTYAIYAFHIAGVDAILRDQPRQARMAAVMNFAVPSPALSMFLAKRS